MQNGSMIEQNQVETTKLALDRSGFTSSGIRSTQQRVGQEQHLIAGTEGERLRQTYFLPRPKRVAPSV